MPDASSNPASELFTDHNSEEWVVPASVRTRTPAMCMQYTGMPTGSHQLTPSGSWILRGVSSCEGAPWWIFFGVLFPHRPALTCLPFRQEPLLLRVHRPRDLYHSEQELDFRCVDWEEGARRKGVVYGVLSICPRTNRGILP